MLKRQSSLSIFDAVIATLPAVVQCVFVNDMIVRNPGSFPMLTQHLQSDNAALAFEIIEPILLVTLCVFLFLYTPKRIIEILCAAMIVGAAGIIAAYPYQAGNYVSATLIVLVGIGFGLAFWYVGWRQDAKVLTQPTS